MLSFCHELKERILVKDEVLFKDQCSAEYIYFLTAGRLKVEKEVIVEATNYWPKKDASWCERKVKNKVMYKVFEILPNTVIG